MRALLAVGHSVHVIAAGAAELDTQRIDDRLTITRLPFAAGSAGAEPELFYGDGAPEALERGGPSVWLQAARFWSALVDAVVAHAARWTQVETHWLVPSALAALRLLPQVPLRAFAHAGDVALLERLPMGDALGRWLARQAEAQGADLIFVSADLQARFAARTGHPIGRVEHLVPPADLFQPITPPSRATARAQLGFDRPTVISVGRLVPIKRFESLIAACAAVARTTRTAPDLVIIGDGPQREALQWFARQHGVRLTLPGFLPRTALGQWLHGADVFAQTSGRTAAGRTEGMPVAALEALAVGLPVVATAASGLRELAGTHAVEVVPPGDLPALAAALARYLGPRFGQEIV